MKTTKKIQAVKLIMALGLLVASIAAGNRVQAQCCVTLNAPSNTASVVISAPSLLPPNDYSTADNAGFLVEQVLVGNSAIPAGTYAGWCIDVVQDIGAQAATYDTTMFSSCDPNLNSELPGGYYAGSLVSPATWHTVNYILNHKNGANFYDVQNAIWNFVGGPAPAPPLGPPYPPVNQAAVNALVQDATANAAAWQSSCGDVTAVIVSVNEPAGSPLLQLTMIEVPCCCGTIGDFIWQDLNGNGCQDAGEPGIAGVKVDLYKGACGGTRTLIATTTTDSTGHYLFTSLCAGDYQVDITAPAGFTATAPNKGCTNASLPPDRNQLDSKCSCVGVSPCTICVTLTSANPNDLNVDCGYVTTLSLQCAGTTGMVGSPYFTALTVSGGCTPYVSFSIVSGSLPPGLTLNPTTGVITGTPTTAGTFPYTAQVKDSCGNTATTTGLSCSITVNPPPTANCVTINAVQNVAITPVTMVGSGGCGGPYTFSATGLPNGLTMSANGTISGTPTVSGTFNYTVTITDKCGDIGTAGCSVTVTTTCPSCTPHNIQYNFNGTQIIFQSTPGGSYVWFTSDGTVSGLPSSKVMLHIHDQTITIPATGSSPQYVVPVPDSYVTFDPSVTVATTTFDTGLNAWLITLPTSGLAGNVFYGGAAFKVPVAGLPGGIKNVNWSGEFTSATPGLSIHWQWHAAAYNNFTSNYAAIAPKPVDDNKASIYKSSDLAGTPEGTDLVSGKPWKTFVIGGASGGGGANYTGSGSSTIQFPPCICPNP